MFHLVNVFFLIITTFDQMLNLGAKCGFNLYSKSSFNPMEEIKDMKRRRASYK